MVGDGHRQFHPPRRGLELARTLGPAVRTAIQQPGPNHRIWNTQTKKSTLDVGGEKSMMKEKLLDIGGKKTVRK